MGCETLTSGIIDVYHDLGLDPTGQVDGYDVLMASIRGLTGHATYQFPPGKFTFSRPIIAGPWAPEFHGAGQQLTILQPSWSSWKPVLIFGLREIDGTNQITSTYRPDSYGKLDTSLTGAPGGRAGFRTHGDTHGITQHHSLALGSYPPQPGLQWSYYGKETALTIETALTFDGGFPANASLFGMGNSAAGDAAPWILGTTGDGRFGFLFRLSDNSQRYCYFTPPAISPTDVVRLRLWIDFNTGTIGAAVNGTDMPLTWAWAPVDFTGLRFWSNTGQRVFTLGADESKFIPDFTVWALRISNAAIKVEPTLDVYRYWNDNTNYTTIAYMIGDDPPGRDLTVWYGSAGNGNRLGSIILMPRTPTGGIEGGGAWDMTIESGSPGIMIVQVLAPFTIENVVAHNSVVGIASLPTFGPSYPIRMNDITVGGSDVAMAINSCEILADGILCEGGGITTLRFFGGSYLLYNVFMARFSDYAETAMEFFPETWGSEILIDQLAIDSEYNSFSDTVIRIRQSPYVGSQVVDIRRLSISQTGVVPIVQLLGHTPIPNNSVWQMGLFYLTHVTLYSDNYAAVLDAGEGWYGTVDVRNLLGNQKVIGSGADNITVVGTSEPGGPPPDPTKTTGIIDVVYDLGLDPAGTVDGYDALMTSIRGLTGPTRYEFPPGDFKFSRPIIAGHLSPEFHGAGRSLTSIGPTGYMKFPTFVFGIREVDGTKQVTAANRPDAYGKLDSSWVGSSGIKTGFRTLGTIWGVAHHHPLALGSMSPQGDNLWTYHSEEAAWTFETAMTFDGGFPSNAHLFGMGVGEERNPAPWMLGTTIDGQFQFFFRTNDDTLYLCYITPPAVTATSVLKLRIWIDWIAGTIGFAINGLAATVTWPWTGVTPDLTGKRFWRNKGVYPFTIGTDKYRRSLPDFTIWGMRVSTIAIKTEPANDVGRYGMDNVNNTTATFMPGDGPPGRDLRMDWGMAYPNGGQGAILLLDREGSYGLGGGGVFDMTINYGSPAILMGQVLTPFRLERLICSGGAVGIGSLPPLSPSYSIVMHEVSVSGSDCGMSLYNTEINAVRLDCPGGGLHSFRAQGGGLMLQHSLIANFHPRAETALEVYGSEWGATVSIDDFLVDNESTTFSDAVIRIAQGAYTGPAMVNIRQVGIGLTSAVPLVILTGNAPVSNDPSRWQMGLFYMSHFSIYSNNYSAALDVGEGWYGTADVRSLGIQTVTGIGARNIRVIGNIKTSGVIDAVEDLGLDPTGTLDGYDILMKSIRGLTGPAHYMFPPGTFKLGRPILAGPFAPEFHGAGMELTTLTSGYNNHRPTLVFGMREIDSGNNQVTLANRPDRAGVLDGTMLGNGFRTLGTVWGIAQDHPLSLGGDSPSHHGSWTYYSELTGWTFEIAMTFNAGFPVNQSICGLGGGQTSSASPWILSTTDDGRFQFYFRTNDQATRLFYFAAPVQPAPPITVIASQLTSNPGNPYPSTTPTDTTSAKLIVLHVIGFLVGTVPTDTYNNTWIPLTLRHTTGASTSNQLYYCINPVVGPGHSFTIPFQYSAIGYVAATCTADIEFVKEVGTVATNVASIQPGSLTPTKNGSLLVQGLNNRFGETAATVNGGYTIKNVTGQFSNAGSLAYLEQGTAAPSNPTFTWTTSSSVASVCGALFRAVSTSVVRLRIWADWTAGTFGAAIDGVDRPLTWATGTPAPGSQFWRSRAISAFYLGCDQDYSGAGGAHTFDFTVWAMRMSNIARKVEPANDQGRYWNDNNAIAYLQGYDIPPTSGPLGRDIDMWWGNAGNGHISGSMFLMPATTVGGGIIGGAVRDMTIENGSPGILIDQVLTPFTLERVRSRYGAVGISTLWGFGPNYTMRFTDVEVQGSDAGVSIFQSEVIVDGLYCERGGITSFRFWAGNALLRNLFIAFFGPAPETALEFFSGGWGAAILVDQLDVDSEAGVVFTAAVIRVDQSPYVGSQLMELRRISISGSGAIPLVKLTGHPPGGPWQNGLFKAEQFTMYSADYTAVVDVSGGWVGTFDARNMGNAIATGTGAGNIEVLAPPALALTDQSGAEPDPAPPRSYPASKRKRFLSLPWPQPPEPPQDQTGPPSIEPRASSEPSDEDAAAGIP